MSQVYIYPILEREMVGPGTVQQIKNHTALQASLRSTQVEVKRTTQQLAAMEAVRGGGFGVSQMGKQELFHVGRSLAGSAAAGIPLEQSVMMEAPRIIESLGPALMKAAGGAGGLTAALGLVATAIGSVVAGLTVVGAQNDAKRIRLANATVEGAFNRRGDTVGATDKDLTDADEHVKSTRHQRHSKKNLFARLFGQGIDDEDVEDVRERKLSIRGRRDDAAARDAQFGQRLFDGDQSAEQAKLTVDYEAKRTAIVKTRAKDVDAQLATAKAEYDTAIAAAARRQQSAQNAVELEEKILQIKKDGADIETATAAARIAAAQKELDNGPKEGPEHQKNVNALNAAQLEGKDASRNTAEEDAQFAERQRIANLRGPEREKERQRLLGEQTDLTNRFANPASPTYDPTSKGQQEAMTRLAEVQSQLHGLDRSDKSLEFQRREEDISANSKLGPQGQIDTANKRMALIQDRAADNAANENDPNRVSKLNEQYAELKRTKDEIAFAEKESLQTLQRQGAELRNHGLELDAQAKKKSIAEKYRPEIEKAERDNDAAKVAQLRANMADEQNNAFVDDALLTPEQRAARTRNNLARSQAAARARTVQEGTRDADGPDGSAIHDADGPDGSVIPDASAGTGAIDSPANIGSKFTLPDLRPALHAGAQSAGSSDGGFSDKNIVTGLREVVTAIKENKPDFRNRR